MAPQGGARARIQERDYRAATRRRAKGWLAAVCARGGNCPSTKRIAMERIIDPLNDLNVIAGRHDLFVYVLR